MKRRINKSLVRPNDMRAEDKLILMEQEYISFQRELYIIKNSYSWGMITKYYNLLERKPSLKKPVSLLKMMIKNTMNFKKNVRKFLALERYNPYSFLTFLKDIDVRVIQEDFDPKKIKTEFALITTIYNESDNILNFLKDIESQTLIPNEVVIVDGGSTDDTIKIVEKFIKKTNLKIKFLKGQRLNIAEGRNKGLKNAKYEIIVFTDAGCRIDKCFCQNLVGTIDKYPDADLVGGIYYPRKKNRFAKYYIANFKKGIYWKNFLPSSRSLLVRKRISEQVNHYPEYLSMTGEDTLYDVNYRKASRKWIINLNAFVFWNSPANKSKALQLTKRYSKGDGESGLGDFVSYHNLIKVFNKKPISLNAQNKARLQGYLEGRDTRSAIEIKKRKIKGVVLMFAGVPFTDSGGGQRCSQLTMEFIRNGYKVVYINLYPSYEPPQVQFFDIDVTLLELYQIDDFSIPDFISRYKEILNKSFCLMEFPHIKFLELVKSLKKEKVKIIYDYIDNWQSSLGSVWYSADIDQQLLDESDYVIASAKTLQEELYSRHNDKKIGLVANAVNTNLFKPQGQYRKPMDLVISKPIIMYVGAMWGEWFDWKLVEFCLKKGKYWNFVFIGGIPEDKEHSYNSKFPNLFFLGLKQQKDLPSYLAYASVCIIPFRNDHITKYVNPLKVYEYLAMHKPVVTSDMEELRDLPYVFCSKTKADFFNNINIAIKKKIDEKLIDTFTRKNNWSSRVNKILKIIK